MYVLFSMLPNLAAPSFGPPLPPSFRLQLHPEKKEGQSVADHQVYDIHSIAAIPSCVCYFTHLHTSIVTSCYSTAGNGVSPKAHGDCTFIHACPFSPYSSCTTSLQSHAAARIAGTGRKWMQRTNNDDPQTSSKSTC